MHSWRLRAPGRHAAGSPAHPNAVHGRRVRAPGRCARLELMNDLLHVDYRGQPKLQLRACTKMELMNESFISSKRDKKTVHNLQLLATVMATRLQPKAYTSRAAARSATYAAPKMPASLPSEATSIAVARLAGNARASYFARRESRNISAEADAPPPST